MSSNWAGYAVAGADGAAAPAPVTVKLVVRPGDAVSANVAVSGTTVTLKVRNLTRRSVFTKKLRMAAPDTSSAEWIAEAPSACGGFGCRTLPLANFGTASFTGATATGNGHAGTISDPAWTATAVTLQAQAQASSGDATRTQPCSRTPSRETSRATAPPSR